MKKYYFIAPAALMAAIAAGVIAVSSHEPGYTDYALPCSYYACVDVNTSEGCFTHCLLSHEQYKCIKKQKIKFKQCSSLQGWDWQHRFGNNVSDSNSEARYTDMCLDYCMPIFENNETTDGEWIHARVSDDHEYDFEDMIEIPEEGEVLDAIKKNGRPTRSF